ncbi:MAG: hypothetical protein CVU38_20355, partial [Chloroflexi bacterium HGW-Chloroflexi-1]
MPKRSAICLAFMPEVPWELATRGQGHLLGWLTVITVDPDQFGATREDIRLAMEAENIEARPVWKPMHLPPYPLTLGGILA